MTPRQPTDGSAQDAAVIRKDAVPRSRNGAAVLERYGLVGLFAAVIVLFSVLRPETFPTYGNWAGIATSQSVLAIAALALIVPLIGGRFDISVGANLGLCSTVTAASMSSFHLPLIVAVLLGVAVGALIGLINGFLVAYLGVNAIIGTLGMAIILGGIVTAYTGGTPISSGLSPILTELSVEVFAGIPLLFLGAVLVAVITWFVLRQTPYGRYLEGVGSNLNAARLTGISVQRIVLLSFVMSGVLAGIAGVAQIAAQGDADPQIGGITFILPALAAAFLGATTWKPGTYNVVGTFIGLYFLSTVISGLSLLGVQPWVTDVFDGAAVVIALIVSAQLRRRRTGDARVGE